MSIFNGLGRALRWLRDRQGKRQYQVADAAGITKAMLSAYETGKQKPSLDTLEKILVALECDLNDLHNALQIVNERPDAIRRAPGGRDPWQGYQPGSGQEAAAATPAAASTASSASSASFRVGGAGPERDARGVPQAGPLPSRHDLTRRERARAGRAELKAGRPLPAARRAVSLVS